MVTFQLNDGGRSAYFKGQAGDCVTRAVTIASGLDYKEVYDTLAEGNASQRKSKRTPKRTHSARHGINTKRKWFKDYMRSLGFTWVPLMSIGSGCKVHLHKDELPTTGHLVLNLSRHLTAYIDGVLHDIYDCSRNGTRCVYGYWRKEVRL
tara:strand:+ start:23045 stop:23494 length:450 start_codon:yes stop_codon:yes gene_type:complete